MQFACFALVAYVVQRNKRFIDFLLTLFKMLKNVMNAI